jgi:hypothetical protein
MALSIMSQLTGGPGLPSFPPLSSVILYLLILSILALAFQALYNRYFHPLRNIPGPFWASISRVWWLLVATGGKQHEIHVSCHEKYGPLPLYYPYIPTHPSTIPGQDYGTWFRTATRLRKTYRRLTSVFVQCPHRPNSTHSTTLRDDQ